jgi:drug/metabolite transporter (DMT)-like permease
MTNPNGSMGNKAVLIHLHIAALLLGGTAQFSKLIDLIAVDIIAYRTLICGLIVLAIAAALKQRIRPRNLISAVLLVICSALFCVHWTAYFHAMQVSSVAVGIVSMFSFPVITVFIEPLFYRNKIKFADIAMGALVLFGVAMMIPELSLGNEITQGVLWGLISALAVAFRNVIVGKYLSDYSPFTVMSYHALISCAILLPFVSVGGADVSANQWLMLFALGSLFTAIPHTQITMGIMNSSAKTTSMIVSLQVVYASLISVALLGEQLTLSVIFGGSCILFAAIFESVMHKKAG